MWGKDGAENGLSDDNSDEDDEDDEFGELDLAGMW